MVRRELDLPRQVKHHIVALERLEPRLEPVEVVLEVLEAVQHRAVRAEIQLLHHVAHTDQLRERDRIRIRHMVVRGVQVDDVHGTLNRREELVHPMAA